MPSALDKAFADSQRSYHAAKAAVAADPGDVLATSRSGLPMGERTNTQSAAQQLAAFKGWPFACIHALASRIAGQAIHVGVQRGEVTAKGPLPRRELFDHPLLTLLNDPNDLQIAWSLWYFTLASLELTGRCLWWRTKVEKREQLLPIPTSWLTGMRGSTRFEAFTIRPPGDAEEYSIDANEACYFFYPSPTGLRDAISPLQAAAYAVDTDDQIQKSQLAAFHNGIFPKHALIVGKSAGPDGSINTGHRPRLTGPQRRQLIRAIHEMYRGSVRSGDPIILDGLVESITKLSNTPAEMDWTESGKAVKARICELFGVNPIILGTVEGANRASSLAAEEHLASTINPKLRLLAGTINEWLCPHYPTQAGKLIVWFDQYEPRDAEMELRRYQLLGQFGAVTPDELREWAGLPPLPAGLGGLPITPPVGVETALERMIDTATMVNGRMIARDEYERHDGRRTSNGKANGHAHG